MVRNTYIYPPGAVDGDRRRHLRVHGRRDAAVQLDLDLRLPHAGGGRDGRPRARLHARRRCRVRPHRSGRRARHRRVRSPSVVLLRHRHELLHGGRQAARRPPAVGQAVKPFAPRNARVAVAAHALPDVGLVAHRPGRVQQRRAHVRRGDGGDAGAHPVAAHERPRRGARPADRLLGAHRPQHPTRAPARVGDLPGDRSVGRQLLRRAADPRPRRAGVGAHRRGRGRPAG